MIVLYASLYIGKDNKNGGRMSKGKGRKEKEKVKNQATEKKTAAAKQMADKNAKGSTIPEGTRKK